MFIAGAIMKLNIRNKLLLIYGGGMLLVLIASGVGGNLEPLAMKLHNSTARFKLA